MIWFDLVDFDSRTSSSPSDIVVSIPRTPLYTSFSSPQKFVSPSNDKAKAIPLGADASLVDPRRSTTRENRKICFLESRALRHAVEQQKRLNSCCRSVDPTLVRTSYTLIPLIEQVERVDRSFDVQVADCLHFGFQTSDEQNCIDLSNDVNRLAFGQIELSNSLAAEKTRLHAQTMKLKLREKKQRKLQDELEQQRKFLPSPTRSKIYIQNGRNALKHRRLPANFRAELNEEIVHFFAHEYQHETRPEMKRLLAELMGVFIEKYPSKVDARPTIIDMDIDPPLDDRDERFPVAFPPPAMFLLPTFSPQLKFVRRSFLHSPSFVLSSLSVRRFPRLLIPSCSTRKRPRRSNVCKCSSRLIRTVRISRRFFSFSCKKRNIVVKRFTR